jgi:hypothetical protein
MGTTRLSGKGLAWKSATTTWFPTDTTNAAVMSLDSKWTPRSQFSHSVAISTSGCKYLKQGSLNVVARDGIEPPTPAFSGLRSTS